MNQPPNDMSLRATRSTADALTALEQRFTYRFAIIASRMGSALAPVHERFGLSVSVWRVLAVIARYEPLSAKNLANKTSADPFRITRALRILSEKNFVSRETDRADRRRASLRLTQAGRAAHDEIAGTLSQMERTVLDALSIREQETLFRLLDKLDEQIGAGMGQG